jgi:uncharacterized alpha-E superfamily protein
MLCRVAEDVFWMSRYVERAIAVGRLIEVTWHLELDVGDADGSSDLFWPPLLLPSAQGGFGPPEGSDALARQDVRYYLAFDRANPNSLVSCILQARTAARGVRESISSDMWEQLNTLYLSLIDGQLLREAEADPYVFYKRMREGAQFFHGLADSTLAHDELWHFVSLGKYLERADNVARVLNLESHLLLDDEASARAGDPLVRCLAVLRSCGAAEAYARYYSLRVEPARVVEFLLLNPVFPQSVRFSVNAAWDALGAIAGRLGLGAEGASPAVRTLGRLRARLEHRAVDEVMEEGLATFLAGVQTRIAAVSDQVTRAYLRDEPQPGRLVAVARAAMIMAAQQQQQ